MKENEIEFITWDNDIRKYIGKKIAELRKGSGMSQIELAEKSGVGHSHIARIELGKYSVGVDTLQKIAHVFDKKIDFVDNPMLSINTLTRLGFEDKGVISQNIRHFKKEELNILIGQNDDYFFQSKSFRHPEYIKDYDQLVKLINSESSNKNILYEHISGVKGVLLKKYTPSGQVENLLIDCGDGLKFHAPAIEFKEIVVQNHYENKQTQ